MGEGREGYGRATRTKTDGPCALDRHGGRGSFLGRCQGGRRICCHRRVDADERVCVHASYRRLLSYLGTGPEVRLLCLEPASGKRRIGQETLT
jgi:hypothetical protein